MATNSNSSTDTPATIVCEFHDKLKNEKKSLDSSLTASRIKVESSEVARGYALCCLWKTDETCDFYRDLDNFELFDMHKSAEIIKSDIDSLVEKDSELGKMITEASKLLNDLQVKLHDANNDACAMHNCLQSHLGFEEQEPPDALACVTKLAKELSSDGKKSADGMVNVAGIHTFSSLEKLQPFGAALTERVSGLKELTDSLIATAKSDKETVQAEVTTILEGLNTEEFEGFRTQVKFNANNCTREFICEGQCEPIKCVEDICKELGSCESENVKSPKGGYTTGDMD